MEKVKFFVSDFWWVLIIGSVALYYDLKVFLFLAFFLVLLFLDSIYRNMDRDRNALIANQILIDRKLRGVFRHLKITEEEKEKILKEAETETSSDIYEWLKKDFIKLRR